MLHLTKTIPVKPVKPNVTITVTDVGGKTGNNGNQFIIRSFDLTSILAPLTGLVMYYKPFINNVSGSGITNDQSNSSVEIMPDGTVHLKGTIKQQTWPTSHFSLGQLTGGKELDFSTSKYVSFKFKGLSTTKLEAPDQKLLDKTQILFRLVDNLVPGQGTSGYDISKIEVNFSNDDAWHDVYLDFKSLFSKDAKGRQTDCTRIGQLMLDINSTWFQ